VGIQEYKTPSSPGRSLRWRLGIGRHEQVPKHDPEESRLSPRRRDQRRKPAPLKVGNAAACATS
jgi:hypothetical protein